MAVQYISGKAGRVQINGDNWNFNDCDVKFTSMLGETTGFEDQAGDGTTTVNRGVGTQDFNGTITGPVDGSNMPASGPTGSLLVNGSVLLNLKIWLDKSVVPRYCGCNYVLVESVNYHPKVEEAIQKVTLSVKAGGAFAAGNIVTITHPT